MAEYAYTQNNNNNNNFFKYGCNDEGHLNLFGGCTTQPHVQSLNLNLEPSTELSNQGIDLYKRKALG